jgi:hypothetical protein
MLNHGRAYALTKEIVSCLDTCISGFSPVLKNSFGSFLAPPKNSFKIFNLISKDSKCSGICLSKFGAQTTPIQFCTNPLVGFSFHIAYLISTDTKNTSIQIQ